jgi:hypothetical protein
MGHVPKDFASCAGNRSKPPIGRIKTGRFWEEGKAQAAEKQIVGKIA